MHPQFLTLMVLSILTPSLVLHKYRSTPTEFYENVQEPWFSYIDNGIKTVEGRLDRNDFSKMKAGDLVTWWTTIPPVTPDAEPQFKTCQTTIEGIEHYPTFKDMIESEGESHVVPGIPTISQGVQIYYQFYKPQEEKTYGVLAIRIKRI
jgi:ASC-1-like (ASCH) protein